MVKRTASIVFAVLLSTALNAQFKKGDKMVGASIGTIFFNNSNLDLSTSVAVSNTSNNNFGISLSPSIGWFINDNIALGIMPVATYKKQKLLGKSSSGSTFLKDESNQFNAGVGGFARYYFKGNSTENRLFGQFDLSFGLGGSKAEGFQYERLGVYVDRYNQKSSGDFFVNTGLTIGLSKFLTKNTCLDFYLGYKFSFINSNPNGTSLRDYSDPGIGDQTQMIDYKQKLTGNNIVLGAGFQVFLPKKN